MPQPRRGWKRAWHYPKRQAIKEILLGRSTASERSRALGDYSLARSRYEQSLALARQVSFHNETLWSLHNLGCLALDQGDLPEARECLAQSLTSRVDEDKIGLVHGALAGDRQAGLG